MTESKTTRTSRQHHLLPSMNNMLHTSNQSRKGSVGAMQHQYQRMLQAAPIRDPPFLTQEPYWHNHDNEPMHMDRRHDRKDIFRDWVLDQIFSKGCAERCVCQLLEQALRRTEEWAVPRVSRYDSTNLDPETLDVFDVPWVWHRVRSLSNTP